MHVVPQTLFPVMQSEFLAVTVARAAALGADPEEILRGTLLRADVLLGDSQPVPSACVYLASTRAARLSGTPYLCAEIARDYDWRAGFHPPVPMGATPSLGDLLLAWLHFVERVQVSMTYHLSVEAGRARLQGRRLIRASQPPGQADAWDIVSWVKILQARLGATWDSGQVTAQVFDRKAIPPDLIPQTRVTNCDAWGLSLSFPSAWLMHRSGFPPPTAPAAPLPERLDFDIARLFTVFDYATWPGQDAFARFLGLHPKTLQRSLAHHGLTGAGLVDNARRTLAQRWLRAGGAPLKQVAYNLGYKNASAFTRACHRWFASPPSACAQRTGD